jgi:sugar phosphate isomerase/epimerase
MNRLLSISTSLNYDIPLETQLALIHESGFTHVSIGGNYDHSGILNPDNWSKLYELLTVNKLAIDTIHGTALDNENALTLNESLAKAAKHFGVRVVVVHASSFTFHPATNADRKTKLKGLLPELNRIASENDIIWAVENVLPGVATDLVEWFIREADSPHIGFCYDCAHNQINGPNPLELLTRLKDKLNAVHISDRSRDFVDHQIPGEGFIDFNGICSLIKQSDFTPPLLMEVMTANSAFVQDAEAFVSLTYNRACEIYDKIWMLTDLDQ